MFYASAGFCDFSCLARICDWFALLRSLLIPGSLSDSILDNFIYSCAFFCFRLIRLFVTKVFKMNLWRKRSESLKFFIILFFRRFVWICCWNFVVIPENSFLLRFCGSFRHFSHGSVLLFPDLLDFPAISFLQSSEILPTFSLYTNN